MSIPLLQHDPKNSADIDESPVDHAPDSWRYGLKSWVRRSKVPEDELVRRYVDARMPGLTAPQTAADWNRIAMLSRMAEGKSRRRYRQKAKGYGEVVT